MEMCGKKDMFVGKSAFGSSQNGQNMPKKGQQEEKNVYIKQGSITHTLYANKLYTLYSL